jgi:hypothetical protein
MPGRGVRLHQREGCVAGRGECEDEEEPVAKEESKVQLPTMLKFEHSLFYLRGGHARMLNHTRRF